ncbi:hypothetical protein OG556_14020 [Kitasatospora sp. NBC_01300]|nr:hypothetical protein OG556_14020 [Kitasatospora sp. NBC_01300]
MPTRLLKSAAPPAERAERGVDDDLLVELLQRQNVGHYQSPPLTVSSERAHQAAEISSSTR